jgi:hypothetical protein
MIGVALPIIRSLLFTMPPMFPTAVAMAFELLTYGLITGLIYLLFKRKNILSVYVSLVAGMLAGRLLWGVAQYILLSSSGKEFTFAAFIAGAFTNAVPGIIVQLVLIPLIMFALDKAKLLPFNSK